MGQITTFEQKINAVTSVKELFTIPDVVNRFITNYKSTTGRPDGESRMEQEKFAYLQKLAENPDLKNVNNYWHVSALIYAATTGLSFRDNQLYVYPDGKGGLKVQASPAGRRFMLEQMPTVKYAPEPILVMKGDHFIHDKLNGVVKEHHTTDKSSEVIKLDNIRAVYQRIIFKDKSIKDVVVYHDDLLKAKGKSRMKSEQGLWEQWPGEASKKTSTNRAFRLYHKYPDNVTLYGNVEDEEETKDTTYDDMPDAPEPVKTSEGETVDTESGEITQTEEATKKNEPAKSKGNFMED